MMREIEGTRDSYWSSLTLTGRRLTGHVWCFGLRFEVDLILGPDPHGFAAITFDGEARWFDPDDPALPQTKDDPALELVAHIYVAGEVVQSVFSCVACGRRLEAGESLPLGYDGEPGDCRHCTKIKDLSELAHVKGVERSRHAAAGELTGFDRANAELEALTVDLDSVYTALTQIHELQKDRRRSLRRAPLEVLLRERAAAAALVEATASTVPIGDTSPTL